MKKNDKRCFGLYLFYVLLIICPFFFNAVIFAGSFVVQPGPLDHFDLKAPEVIQEKKEFKVLIEAKDAWGNQVINYYQVGRGVDVLTNGRGKISPVEVLPWSFEDGRAIVYFRYSKIEAFSITVREKEGQALGTSPLIRAYESKAEVPGDNLFGQEISEVGQPDHFVVIVPREVMAGQAFELIIEARDRENKLVFDYNLKGPDVEIFCSPPVTDQPMIVKKVLFDKGRAVVSFTGTRSGMVTIMAKPRQAGLTDAIYSDKEIPTAEASVSSYNRQEMLARTLAKLDEELKTKKTQGITPEKKAASDRTGQELVGTEKGPLPAVLPRTEENKKEADDIFRRARQLIEQGDYLQAQKMLEKAVELDPDNEDIRITLNRLNQVITLIGE